MTSSSCPDRALVTGGAGFIGSRLTRALLDAGREVVVLDALVESVHGPDASPPELIGGARFIRGDVRDADAWTGALDGVGVVYHLAAETGTGESMYRSQRYVDVNVGGTAVLCDLLAATGAAGGTATDGTDGSAAGAAAGVGRVVLASSRAVYGEGPYRCPVDGIVTPGPRTDARLASGAWDPACPVCGGAIALLPSRAGLPTRPTSVYGMTKRGQEEMLDLVAPATGTDVVALRLQNVYGPGQSLRNPYTGILSIFSVRMLAGQGIRIFEDGLESRDFVFVDDVVDAFVRAADLDVGPERVAVVDVGSGVATTVSEIARLLAERYGASRADTTVTGEYRLGDIRHAVADVEAARDRLGITSPTSLETGLDAFAAWVRETERPESTLDAALDEMAARGLLGRAGPRS